MTTGNILFSDTVSSLAEIHFRGDLVWYTDPGFRDALIGTRETIVWTGVDSFPPPRIPQISYDPWIYSKAWKKFQRKVQREKEKEKRQNDYYAHRLKCKLHFASYKRDFKDRKLIWRVKVRLHESATRDNLRAYIAARRRNTASGVPVSVVSSGPDGKAVVRRKKRVWYVTDPVEKTYSRITKPVWGYVPLFPFPKKVWQFNVSNHKPTYELRVLMRGPKKEKAFCNNFRKTYTKLNYYYILSFMDGAFYAVHRRYIGDTARGSLNPFYVSFTYENMLGQYQSYRLTQLDNNHWNALLSKIGDKFRRHDFNLGNTLVEIDRTLGMLWSAVKRIEALFVAAKTRDVLRLGEAFGFSKSKTNNIVQLAQNWLEYDYGWAPLLSDVKHAAEAVGEAMIAARDAKYRIRASKSQINSGLLSMNHDLNNNSVPMCYGPTRYYSKVTQKLIFEIDTTGFVMPDGFLLRFDDASQYLWEADPFSFVFDWFVKIQVYLEALNSMNVICPISKAMLITMTTFNHERLPITDDEDYRDAAGHLMTEEIVGSTVQSEFTFDRHAVADIVVKRPEYVPLGDVLSVKHILDTVGLVLQLVGKSRSNKATKSKKRKKLTPVNKRWNNGVQLSDVQLKMNNARNYKLRIARNKAKIGKVTL